MSFGNTIGHLEQWGFRPEVGRLTGCRPAGAVDFGAGRSFGTLLGAILRLIRLIRPI